MDHCRVLTAGVTADFQPLTVGLSHSASSTDMAFEALIVPREPGLLSFIGLAYILSRVDTAQYILR